MYHKYVCRPKDYSGFLLKDYLESCEEEYNIRKFYKIKTFEQEIAIKDMAFVKNQIDKYYKKENSFDNLSVISEMIPQGRQ